MSEETYETRLQRCISFVETNAKYYRNRPEAKRLMGLYDSIYLFLVELKEVRLMYVTRLEGEWIMVEDEDFSGGGYNMCSACNYKFSFGAYNILEHDRFCPHCGAKMKGGNVS